MGAWIETFIVSKKSPNRRVAPYVGAWIETQRFIAYEIFIYVAPYVGAWIETGDMFLGEKETTRRTLRGCVD